MKKVSLQEAKKQGLLRYFTGVPCKQGHIAERRTTARRCLVCANELQKKIYGDSKDKISKRMKNYRKVNKDKISKQMEIWRSNNVTHEKEYRKANRHIINANGAKYRASKLQATPVYADQESIIRFYRFCLALNRLGRTKFHVDHIVPLQHEKVCGLHVEDNLQILTEKENTVKGNQLWL